MVASISNTPAFSKTSFPPKVRGALAHIPGDDGLPLLGHTLQVLSDPRRYTERSAAKYGQVFRNRVFGETTVALLGPEANEFVLLDSAKLFSSTGGWEPVLGRLFPRGLMILDFEEHRLHRRVLSVAFKSGPMRSYFTQIDKGIAERISRWRSQPGEMLLYPAIKQMTLDLAATSFLGTEIGAEADEIGHAFIDMLIATAGIVRQPLPGTQMARGVKGRKRVLAYFAHQVPIRREKGGDDLFSQLCRSTDEDGALLSTDDILNHITFLMAAAHDTLTSSLTALIGALAAYPAWQDKLRREVDGLGLTTGEPMRFDQLEAMPLSEMALKEALRQVPPLYSIPRRAVRDFSFGGFHVPAGSMVGIKPLHTHHLPEIWPDPDVFDPMRFTEEAQRARHRFAWIPFGGGAHMCLGLNFAYMQAKCFLRHFLQNLSVEFPPGYRPDWRMCPIPRPRDGSRVHIKPI